MEPEKTEFIRLTAASREAVEKLDRYAELLGEWNQKFNLVSPSTIPTIWTRHFLDSAQLVPLIQSNKSNPALADLGSGAGFPGIVLGIMGIDNINLIEGTGKKAEFLRLVIKELGLDIHVHQARIEDIKDFKADIITARALAALKELLPLAARLIQKDGLCLFLKGKNADLELTESKKYWMFDCVSTPSLSDASGKILAIRNLKNHAGRPPKLSKRT